MPRPPPAACCRGASPPLPKGREQKSPPCQGGDSEGVCGRQSGFTLLELMVVLVIMILIVSLVPPMMTSAGLTTELRGAARQLAAGLRAARNRAVTEQQSAALTINLEGRKFSVDGDKRQIALPGADDVAIKLYTAQAELIDETSGNIRFFPDGTSTGGYIALADNKVEYRINVDWLTGHVNIEDKNVTP